MEPGNLLIDKECVWYPDLPDIISSNHQLSNLGLNKTLFDKSVIWSFVEAFMLYFVQSGPPIRDTFYVSCYARHLFIHSSNLS